MKVIIAGGRNLAIRPEYLAWVAALDEQLQFEEIVCGMQQGGDMVGLVYAKQKDIPVKSFEADWYPNGVLDRSAGPRRNQAMACYASACALLPGNDGTADMKSKALKRGLLVFEYPSLVGYRRS